MMMDRVPAEDFSVFDTIGNSVFVIQRDTTGEDHLIHLNAAYRLRAGASAHSMLGPIKTVFPARVADTMAQSYTAALRSDGPLAIDELLAIAGVESWWRTTLTRDPNRPGRLIGSAVEITDLEGRARSLTRTLAETTDRLDELRTVAALTAHDTRAPLSNVVSLMDIVLDGFRDLGDGKVEMLRACGDVATTALDSIESLMARVGDTAPRIRGRDRVDLGQVCREVAAIVDPTERMRVTHPEATVVTDHVVLQTSLRNLMDNAARYARSRIEISVSQTDADTVGIIVADDGPGFPDGVDPLIQIEGVTRIDGMRGYGMPAVAQLLHSCGGSLEHAPSRFGTGATLRVRLPGTILPPEQLSRSA